jgi:hypothetical protein
MRANSRARKVKRLPPTAGLGANQYEMMMTVRITPPRGGA